MEFELRNTDSILEVNLSGRMEFTDHIRFRELINSISNERSKSIVFNLSNLDFIDSSGLGMLIIANSIARQNKLNFSLRSPKEMVKRILEVAKFHTIAAIEA
ncbi:MAG: STAS domain-containing protein [Alphaproteobacteria bacterium]|nr:STAS domain-containing protein [Alphaproteobacteria bacterium]